MSTAKPENVVTTFVCEYCGHANEVECRPEGSSLLARSYLRCGNCDREQSAEHDLHCGHPLHLWYKIDHRWVQRY
ncbi:MAG: hypothetical protein ACE14L_00605 [Terriglobales bacterium]